MAPFTVNAPLVPFPSPKVSAAPIATGPSSATHNSTRGAMAGRMRPRKTRLARGT
ncbi:hypothetical protein A176_001323 [Myxococcus hansupus]|uniref:Uncharacterized protein n=1 Tax=Pseudomyxococcus hansupus TaxID=1297742 RepID=A0A0H4WLY7_9BACT|nr:hypothetical protein A176_001323 [Myxococcus hansupus]